MNVADLHQGLESEEYVEHGEWRAREAELQPTVAVSSMSQLRRQRGPCSMGRQSCAGIRDSPDQDQQQQTDTAGSPTRQKEALEHGGQAAWLGSEEGGRASTHD